MSGAALALALAALAGTQEEPSIEEEIAALVAKTNALEGFHLVYELEGMTESDPSGTMELFYRAPDIGGVRAPELGVEAWVVGGTILARANGQWRRVVYPGSEARRILDELFPRDEEPAEPGVGLMFRASDPTGDDEHPFQLTYAWQPYGRRFLLGWLTLLQKRPCTRDGGSLVCPDGAVTLRVSRESGVLESAEVRVGERFSRMRLREARLGDEVDAEAFSLPDEARDAEIDAEAARATSASAWMIDREVGFARANGALDERELDEPLLADWRAFLAALHREFLETPAAEERERLERTASELAGEVRSSLATDPSPDNRELLRRDAADRRAALESELDERRDARLGKVPPLRREPRAELLDAEREVIAEVWRELVLAPALESFDREIARAFGE